MVSIQGGSKFPNITNKVKKCEPYMMQDFVEKLTNIKFDFSYLFHFLCYLSDFYKFIFSDILFVPHLQ